MQCPFLKGKSVKMCGAVSVTVLLDAKDLEKYCLSKSYTSCPVYSRLRLHGQERMSLKEYYLVTDKPGGSVIDPDTGEITT